MDTAGGGIGVGAVLGWALGVTTMLPHAAVLGLIAAVGGSVWTIGVLISPTAAAYLVVSFLFTFLARRALSRYLGVSTTR